MQGKQRKQTPPNWGVMFSDGSVMHPWNGRTQIHQAQLELTRLKEEYPNDNITLAYRRGPDHQWKRITGGQDS